MNYHFRNLVFEGGGVKGIAYVGALSVLEEKGILQSIKRVGGTSAGAIVALLVALEYSMPEMKAVLWSVDFNKFLDSTWGVVRNTERLIREYGWYKGDYFKNWIGELIAKKTGSKQTTFKELNKMNLSRELYLIGTNLSTGFAEIFSYSHSPDMSLAEAVRISMSIPLFFTAVHSKNNDVFVDGGVLENYPIKLFDRKSYIDNYYRVTNYYREVNNDYKLSEKDAYVFNMETLGFRLDSRKEIKIFEKLETPEEKPINDFFEYLKRLFATLLDSQQNRHLYSDDWHRTIYIDSLEVKTTDFEISKEKKNALISSGRECTLKYLDWFDTSKDALSNRPADLSETID